MKPAIPLTIGIASTGRFHMMDLARQLAALGQQARLFTAIPDSRWTATCAPSREYVALVLLEQACRRLPVGSPSWLRVRMFEDFGRWLERFSCPGHCGRLDALEGSGLEAGRTVRDTGGIWICNRGSSMSSLKNACWKRSTGVGVFPCPSTSFRPLRGPLPGGV